MLLVPFLTACYSNTVPDFCLSFALNWIALKSVAQLRLPAGMQALERFLGNSFPIENLLWSQIDSENPRLEVWNLLLWVPGALATIHRPSTGIRHPIDGAERADPRSVLVEATQ